MTPFVMSILGSVICGIGLLLTVLTKSPVSLGMLLPLGLGLYMWADATERNARIGVLAFTVGLWVAVIGIATNMMVLVMLALIPTSAGVFTWALLKD